MPLSLNVGLSRKASRNYQSTGVSINLIAELDQSLLAKPEELQRQIDGLYAQAEQAMTRQIQAYAARASPHADGRGDAQGRANQLPSPASADSQGVPRAMTKSQRRAIVNTAGRLNLDPAEEIHRQFGWEFERLSVHQASAVIDHLRKIPLTAKPGKPRGQDGQSVGEPQAHA